MSEHKYPAPALERGRFRLLKLSRSAEGTPECVLSEHSLDSPPIYTPVSYTWGPAESPNPTSQLPDTMLVNTSRFITLNGREWEVTPNLFDLLQELSSVPEIYRWIDALCINQGDIDERASQVNLMDRVYTQAYAVFVWLGRANEHTSRVMAMISQLARINKDEMNDGWSFAATKKGTHISDGLGRFILDEAITDSNWDALTSFFDRRWFFRVWTVQEFALSRRFILRWGPVQIEWQELSSAARFLLRTRANQGALSNTRQQVPVRAVANINLTVYEVARGWLYSTCQARPRADKTWPYNNEQASAAMIVGKLIELTGESGASDPRDRIFAFLGIWIKIAKERFGQELDVRADYSKTVQAVYTEFMTTLLHESDSLDSLLSFRPPGKTARIKALPSWVPDYSLRSYTPMIYYVSQLAPHKSIDASANMRSHDPPQRDAGNRIFHVFGNRLFIPTFVFGEVTHTGNVALDAFKGDYSKTQELLLASPQRHPDGRSRLRAFHPVLSCDTGWLSVTHYRCWWTCQFLINVKNVRRSRGVAPQEWFHPETSSFLERMLAGEDDACLPTFDEFKALCEENGIWKSGDINVDVSQALVTRKMETELHKFAHHIKYVYGPSRRPVLLDNGYYGMTSEDVRPGDTVRILPGARTFFTFRKADLVDSKEDRQVLIGEAYVSGAMEGEASEYVKQTGRPWDNICVV